MNVLRQIAACGALASIVVGLAGCGGGKADVTGKVSYKGKLLTTGTVSMVGPDGMVKQGLIAADGTYAVAGVAAGNVQIGVASPRPGGDSRAPRRPGPASRLAAPNAGVAGDAANWFPIPDTYLEPTTSGLATTLKSGANQYDIELR
jgi:hypothetical protein